MGGQRELFRVSIARKGVVRRWPDVAPCDVVELTAHGIGLTTDLPVAPGDTVDVAFDLADRCRIACTLLVTHAVPPRLGGRMTAVSDEHRRQLMHYLDDHASVCLAVL
jgi:hypothetical protein